MTRKTLTFLALLALALPGLAQEWADPTRPPSGSAAVDSLSGESAMGPQLQSVKLPRSGKPVAIIDGQAVMLGQMVGDMRLIRVSESGAVLQGPGGRQELRLIPGVEKRPVKVVPKKETKAGQPGAGEKK